MNIRNLQLNQYKNKKKEKVVLPTGEYIGILLDSEVETSKAGDLILKFCWVIEKGKYKGSKYFTYFNLNKEQSVQVLAKMIVNMGFDLGSIESTNELNGHQCRFRVKQIHHMVHGKSNRIERYLPLYDAVCEDIPFDLLVGNQAMSNN